MSMLPRRRRDDRWPYRVWAWLRRGLATIGALVLFSVILMTASLSRLADLGAVEVSDEMVLTYIIDEDLREVPEPPSLANPRLIPGETLHDVIDALDLARDDARIKGLVVRLDAMSLSLAQVQELRDAVARFREAGKFAVIHAADYGALGSAGMSQYYLASAFSEIWVQPVGGVAMPGMVFQVPFLKTLLSKLGMQADMVQMGEYKSAPESLTDTQMSAAARSNLGAVLDALSAQVIADIAKVRGIDAGAVTGAINAGLLTAEEAQNMKLVTHIGYVDECVRDAKSRAGQIDVPEGEGTTDLLAYADHRADEVSDESDVGLIAGIKAKFAASEEATTETAQKSSDKNVIALITASGEIVDDSAASAMAGDLITPDAMRKAFAEVRDRDDVGVIVLRIDSPGGSAFASESIRRMVVRAKERGVPVIVSMGGVAASGGYWIASAADRIIAQPGTLTGSIGVFGGKVVIDGTLDRMGVNVETLKTAPRADMLSALRPMTADERALLERHMGNTYDAFITRVADGRKMARDAVERVAGGQVFTGSQARDKGLVDALGGIDVAIAEANALLQLPEGAKGEVVIFPEERSPIEALFAIMSGERVSMPFRPDAYLLRAQPTLLAPIRSVR